MPNESELCEKVGRPKVSSQLRPVPELTRKARHLESHQPSKQEHLAEDRSLRVLQVAGRNRSNLDLLDPGPIHRVPQAEIASARIHVR